VAIAHTDLPGVRNPASGEVSKFARVYPARINLYAVSPKEPFAPPLH